MKRLLLVPMVFWFLAVLDCSNSTNSIGNSTPNISISPTSAKVLVNQTTQFEANVQGMSSSAVNWSVKESSGGTVTAGLYHAPWNVGTYHLIATAAADDTMTATATVTVTAFTAFLEALPGGTSTPVAVTPVLGMLQADGAWQAAPIIDPTTNAPMDTSFSEISLSGNGTNLVASQPLSVSGVPATWNIFTFNSGGTGMTNLTNNVPGGTTSDYDPQLSPDGKLIVYSHSGQIWVMNADGSNPHHVESTGTCVLQPCVAMSMYHTHPSFSPDASQIVFEYWEKIDSDIQGSGIAIANVDGTAPPTALTSDCGGIEFECTPQDARPAFTSDGSKIVFASSRPPEGILQTAGVTVYMMNPDGSNLVPLYTSVTSTTLTDPRALADRIVFSGDMDNPTNGTNGFEIYSVMLDGSNLARLTNNSLYDGFSVVGNSETLIIP